MDEINQIMSMATANIHNAPFVCRSCCNTGKLEVIVYEGKTIPGFYATGQEIIGYSRFFRAVWLYYQTFNPKLSKIDQLVYGREELKQLEIAKSKLDYDPHNYYRVTGMVDCNYCKKSLWSK